VWLRRKINKNKIKKFHSIGGGKYSEMRREKKKGVCAGNTGGAEKETRGKNEQSKRILPSKRASGRKKKLLKILVQNPDQSRIRGREAPQQS